MGRLIFSVLIAVLLTTSSNAQWQQIGPTDSLEIRTLTTSGSNIFAGGFDGVYLSTNNGANWTLVVSGLPNNGVVHTLTVIGINIFAGTNNEGVYRSTDNGQNWFEVNNGLILNDAYAFGVSGSNVFVGFDGGSTDKVFRTTNNGNNWLNVTNDFPSGTGDIFAFGISGNIIFAGANSVHKTTNNGVNWSIANTDLPGNSAIKSFCVIGTTIITGGFRNGIFISTNNGANWQSFNNGLPGNVHIRSIINVGSNILLGTDSNGVFLSTNNGISWVSKNDGLNDLKIYSILISGNYLFAGSIGSSVWRRPLSEIIGIQSISTEPPSKYSISQNYPNPFNPTTQIEFSIPENNEFVKLTVFDIAGKEIKTLVNQQLNVGTYKVDFTGENLASGVYFYKWVAGHFTVTKKMILMK